MHLKAEFITFHVGFTEHAVIALCLRRLMSLRARNRMIQPDNIEAPPLVVLRTWRPLINGDSDISFF
jgi:hypothetical protein